MQETSPTNSEEVPPNTALARVALCQAILPVWGRHLATSRAQSEGSVTEMLRAFAEIGPHINMAERQSQQINDALAQPVDGVMGLANACAHVLAPVLASEGVPFATRAAIEQVLGLVQSSVAALEGIAKPFQHETQMVAAHVERMYMGFQYQDRISQMLNLLEADVARLQQVFSCPDVLPPDAATWLAELESHYAMAEQRRNHEAERADKTTPDCDETTFF